MNNLFYFFLLFLILIFLSVAFFTLLERKVIGLIQYRLGPNKSLILGLVQPVADGIKFFLKSTNSAKKNFFFFLGPLISFLMGFGIWSMFFFSGLKLKIIFLIIIMSINSYAFIVTGWASYSKFSYLGGIRGSSQTISYEIGLIILIFLSIFFLNNLNISSFNIFFFFLNFCFLIVWILTILAETNRSPFDFSEGESELISGFNTEYGSVGFVFFMLAEYSTMIFFSFFLMIILNMNIFFLILLIFLFTRSSFPRYRYDFLMNMMWFKILPFSCFFFFFIMNF